MLKLFKQLYSWKDPVQMYSKILLNMKRRYGDTIRNISSFLPEQSNKKYEPCFTRNKTAQN